MLTLQNAGISMGLTIKLAALADTAWGALASAGVPAAVRIVAR